MNISLNKHFDQFVGEAVKSGRYKSSSEVIREGLRLLEEREARLTALRHEIDRGRESGKPVAFNPEKIKKNARKRLRSTSAK